MDREPLDDINLIRLFIQGQAHLLANEHLNVREALDTHQLLTRSGQILAIARTHTKPPEVEIRAQSSYANLLHKTLESHGFLSLEADQTTNFVKYRYHPAPSGYQLSCTPARILWREWWIRYSHYRQRLSPLQMDLLLFTHETWYPIRNIVFSDSHLFVSTYRGETVHQGEDMIVWAEKQPETSQEQTQFFTTQQVQSKAPRSDVPQRPIAASQSPVPQTATALSTKPQNPDQRSQLLEKIAHYQEHKLFIKTALGTLVVEGTNLQYHLCGQQQASGTSLERRDLKNSSTP